jgi:hypothetical protein
MTRENGWLPDFADRRDKPLAATIETEEEFPESCSLSMHVPFVLDQGGLGSCVAHAVLYATMVNDAANGRRIMPFSRLFAYWHSRNQHGDASKNTGTYIRTLIKVLNTLGRPPESEWTYEGDPKNDKFTKKPPLTVMLSAFDRRKADYSRIDADGEERIRQIKASICNKRPVVFGTGISSEFAEGNTPPGGVWRLPSSTIGGHAMCAVGYKKTGLVIVNSWGLLWGDNMGYATLDWEWIADPSTRDLWSISL